MKKFNKSEIMKTAWKTVKKYGVTISVALKMAWKNAKALLMAKMAAGIKEETHTWFGWKVLGYEVIHESKAMFKVVFDDLGTKKGTRVMSYFGAHQVALAE